MKSIVRTVCAPAVGLLLASLLAIFSLSGCGGPSSSSTGKVLIYAQAEDPATLDPINTDIAEAVHVITNVFDTLVTYHDETTELVPSLATSWTTSEDGLTWTFKLRTDVKFHDGELLDSSAVKLSFERLLEETHPLVFDQVRPYQSAYNMIDVIETPDAETVVMRLKAPSAILLSNLAMFPASIVSPKGLEKHQAGFGEHPVGTGPFKMVKWARDQQLVLAAFDKHFAGRPKVDTLIVVPVKENATRVERLSRGEIHAAENLTPVELDSLSKNPAIQVEERLGMNVAYLTMQNEKSPFNLPEVRRAIWMAIDKKTLIEVGYSGHATPAHTMVPPAMWGHDDKMVDREFNREEAKRMMAEAAEKHGFQLPLKVTLSVMNQARPYLQQPLPIAGFMKDSLREIGIELTIVGRDVNQHFVHVMRGEHDLGLAGWNSDNADPDNFLYSLLDPDNISNEGNNLSRWRNDRFHELMLAGQTELDTEKRLAIYLEAQKIVFEEAPVVPLVHTQLRMAHVKSLKGYHLHPTGLVRLKNAYFESPQ